MGCHDKTIHEQAVIFKNRREQHLFGVLHLPTEETKPPVVIMAHGFTDDKTGDNRLFVKFARKTANVGIAVLRFDFAGSGDSEGDFSQITLTSEIEDLEDAVNFAYSLPEIDNSRINLIGYSLGGAVSIALAATEQKINSFIGWAPVSDPKATFQRILGKRIFSLANDGRPIACKNGNKQFYLRKEFFDSIRNFDPLYKIPKVSPRPTLLVQGSDDKKVLTKETELLFQNAQEPKEIHFIQGAGHSFAFFEEQLFEITLKHLMDGA
jgi:fermentation-respiration switch protein FrsA (DUF1100 family)